MEAFQQIVIFVCVCVWGSKWDAENLNLGTKPSDSEWTGMCVWTLMKEGVTQCISGSLVFGQ